MKPKLRRGGLDPDLDRFKNWKQTSNPNVYVPYSKLKEDYHITDPVVVSRRACVGMRDMFKIPLPLISSKFEEYILDVLNRQGLRMSSVRAVFEGRIPGVPKPSTDTDITRLATVCMALCDVCDTIVYDYLSSLDEKDQAMDASVGIK